MSFLTNSGVGRDTICSSGGGLSDLTSKKGWAPKYVSSVGMGVSGFLSGFESRRAATVLDLILFLGGFSAEGKIRDEGLLTPFLNVFEFCSFLVFCTAVSLSVLKLSKLVLSGVNTGGGENSHLSSLRNACGECKGVDGGVFGPSSNISLCLSGDGNIGINGSLSFKITVLLFSLSNSILFCKVSLPGTFHYCQSFLWDSL